MRCVSECAGYVSGGVSECDECASGVSECDGCVIVDGVSAMGV